MLFSKKKETLPPTDDAQQELLSLLRDIQARLARIEAHLGLRSEPLPEPDPDGTNPRLQLPVLLEQLFLGALPTPAQIASAWTTNHVDAQIAAPVGLDESGKICCLDVSDRGHGPHGMLLSPSLTGSAGLCSLLLLGLGARYSPRELRFIRVRAAEGGGCKSPTDDLPHTLATYSADSAESLNALLDYLQAELRSRQRLLQTADAPYILDYMQKSRADEALPLLPWLVLAVDDITGLSARFPEQCAKLFLLVRVSRSLGLSFIAADCRQEQPSDQLLSMCRFKLCAGAADADTAYDTLHRGDLQLSADCDEAALLVGTCVQPLRLPLYGAADACKINFRALERLAEGICAAGRISETI